MIFGRNRSIPQPFLIFIHPNQYTMKKPVCFLLLLTLFTSCQKKEYDIVIRGGTVYDGSGKPGAVTDVAINADTIAFIGDLSNAIGKKEIDAKGLAVSPGFINMLSHAEVSLLFDGNSQSDIRQGVTLEVFGEGSMGPMNESMKKAEAEMMKRDRDWEYKIDWTTLGEYLESLERKGDQSECSIVRECHYGEGS